MAARFCATASSQHRLRRFLNFIVVLRCTRGASKTWDGLDQMGRRAGQKQSFGVVQAPTASTSITITAQFRTLVRHVPLPLQLFIPSSSTSRNFQTLQCSLTSILVLNDLVDSLSLYQLEYHTAESATSLKPFKKNRSIAPTGPHQQEKIQIEKALICSFCRSYNDLNLP